VKFQQALPFCVFPVSSQLAALHAASQSCPVPDSCKSCGSYLSTHVTVMRNRRHSRVITSSCNACGRINSTPLHKGNSTTFPPRKRRASTLHTSSNPIPDIPLPPNQASFASTSAASSTKPSKPLSAKENNKKFRLHDMLKKNREKEQRRSNMSETSSGGLSAFLNTL
jgi:hypothetical protein